MEAKAAHTLGLTPNVISMLGFLLALFSAAAYFFWQVNSLYLFVAVVLLLFSGFCDALDGVVARLYQQSTILGGFLDSLLDRYSDAAICIGIIISGLCDVLWGLIAIVGSLLVSYTRARAEACQIKMESIGIAERAERILILSIASIAAFLFEPKITMNIAMVLLGILSNLTVVQRSIHTYRRLKKKEATLKT